MKQKKRSNQRNANRLALITLFVVIFPVINLAITNRNPHETDAPQGNPHETDVPHGNPHETDAPHGNPHETDAPHGNPHETDAPQGGGDPNATPPFTEIPESTSFLTQTPNNSNEDSNNTPGSHLGNSTPTSIISTSTSQVFPPIIPTTTPDFSATPTSQSPSSPKVQQNPTPHIFDDWGNGDYPLVGAIKSAFIIALFFVIVIVVFDKVKNIRRW